MNYATPGATTLEWAEPENVGASPVEGYTVFVREQGTTPWEKLTGDLISEPKFDLSDLKKNKPYQARVTATNAKGESQPSEPSNVFELKPDAAVEEPDAEIEKPTMKRQPSQTDSAEVGKN